MNPLVMEPISNAEWRSKGTFLMPSVQANASLTVSATSATAMHAGVSEAARRSRTTASKEGASAAKTAGTKQKARPMQNLFMAESYSGTRRPERACTRSKIGAMRRLALLFLAMLPLAAQTAEQEKVFRYAFRVAETSFDPQKVIDLYSNIANSAMFDAPLRYDYLASPPKLKPNTLTSLPEISADGKTFTMHVKPGIYFTDDPAFGGKKRELVAEDYVYSMKRLMDPKLSAPLLSEVEDYILGASEAVAKARKENKFDYDAPIEGLRALDRYTLQISLPSRSSSGSTTSRTAACRVPSRAKWSSGTAATWIPSRGDRPISPGLLEALLEDRVRAQSRLPRGPFRRRAQSRRCGRAAILARQKGKRLPLIDRVEVYIIEEEQPRWLSFQNEQMDLIFEVPFEFANVAMPNNKVAKNLERRGIVMRQVPSLDLYYAYFNMEDPTVGGYTPDKVALRRAIRLVTGRRKT